MPPKRRWSGESSSSHLAAESAATAAANPTAAVRSDAAADPSKSKILIIGYPVSDGESDQQKIGGFLESCHYCKKRIAKDSEVFMYGNLRAFCSADCRDNQITMDYLPKEQASNYSKEKPVSGHATRDAKNQSSS